MSIYTKTLRQTILFSLIYFLVISFISEAQNINTDKYQYLYPVPGSKLNSIETTIIIRFGDSFENYGLENSIVVRGSKSGLYKGKIILAENNRTLIFHPNNQFAYEEVITVELSKNIRTVSNKKNPALQYSFETSRINVNKQIKYDHKKYSQLLSSDLKIDKGISLLKNNNHQEIFNKVNYTIQRDSLPNDFPELVVDSINNPSPGLIFLAPFYSMNYNNFDYLIILDNYCIPVFFRRYNAFLFDFKKQSTGVLTHFYSPLNAFFALDSSYNVIDTFFTKNGYITDPHELLLSGNNHSLMMSYDWQPVDMDTVVPGGDPNAMVAGLVIQEQDENKNVVFQWRSWDHFKITDATYDINLTDSLIDYVHGNAIQIDDDGNLLISSRHLDEITKIHRQTGDIIWRWGGEHCKNNQFTFINDPIGFSHQHDVRRLENGNITLFDNGNLHSPPSSRVVEYQLDEENKLAFRVWEYNNEPISYSIAMGDARRLPNHNTLIGWGTGTSPAICEVKPDGDIALFLTIPDTMFNYRGFKFSWKTNLFVTNPENLSFGHISLGDSLIQSLKIINNSEKPIKTNGLLNRDSAFTVITPLPIKIDALKDSTIQVKFKPARDGNYSDDLYLQSNSDNERIAQVVQLSGTTITSVEYEWNKFDYTLGQNYPNPFNPSTKISWQAPVSGWQMLKVYDILGREVAMLVNEEKPAGSYEVEFNGNGLAAGVYFYRLQAVNYVEIKKMIYLK